jgi:hypothetical protein
MDGNAYHVIFGETGGWLMQTFAFPLLSELNLVYILDKIKCNLELMHITKTSGLLI